MRVTDDTSLLLPGAQAKAQVEAARTALEARRWIGEGSADDRVRLAVPGDYGVILTIPEEGRILVTVRASCATP